MYDYPIFCLTDDQHVQASLLMNVLALHIILSFGALRTV